MRFFTALLLILTSAGPAFAVSGIAPLHSVEPVTLFLTPKAGRAAWARAAKPAIPAQWLTEPVLPLFSPSEQEALAELGDVTAAQTLKVTTPSPDAAHALKRWCRRHWRGWSLDENTKLVLHDEQFQDSQWGLVNTGSLEGLVLDSFTTVPIQSVPGEDIGALRGLPEPTEIPAGQTARHKIVVAVLDTGLDTKDYQGNPSLHPEFIGQIIDKTKPDEQGHPGECDTTVPGELQDRISRFNLCISQNRTDCVNPDSDRDGNGYPFDCQGWNVTAPRDKVTDILGNDDTSDKLGHGTHVSGIIAAAADGPGVRGVMTKNIAILPVKVVDKAPNAPRTPQEFAAGGTDALSCVGDARITDLLADEASCSTDEADVPGLLQSLGKMTTVPPPQEHDINPNGKAIGFADQIARGILYAIRSHAQVISMSLAWPGGADSELMRQMVALAQAQNPPIIVVASAGNDSTEARTMPCEYPGVICVAAHDSAGDLTFFSNFGAAVDIAAPGQNILSTWIRKSSTGRPITNRKWTDGGDGLEQKSGTSMSAPFVAGEAARLLDLGFSPTETIARLLVGVRPLHSLKDPGNAHPVVRTGSADLEKAESAVPQPLILPEPKGPLSVLWDPTKDSAELSLSLRNLWIDATQAQVSIELATDEEPTLAAVGAVIDPATAVLQLPTWPAGQSQTITTRILFGGSLTNRLKLNGRFFIRVRVTASNIPGGPKIFPIPVELVAEIGPESTFPGSIELPIDGDPISPDAAVNTIVPRDGSATSEYLITEPTTDPTQVHFKVYREQPAVPPLLQRFALAAEITQPRVAAVSLAEVERVDHEINQPSGYVFIYQLKAPQGSNVAGFEFDFYDSSLKPVKALHYDNVVSILDSGHFVWLRATENGKPVRVPAWIGNGLLPKEDYPDVDFYRDFFTGVLDRDFKRTITRLQDLHATPRTREQSRQDLVGLMQKRHQDQSQRNRFYFLEPTERRELDPITGAETGDVKAIARTGDIDPTPPASGGPRQRGVQPPLVKDFTGYVPLWLIAQTAQERDEGSVRVLLARPERTSSGEDIRGSLRYAIGVVREGKSLDPTGGHAWIIGELEELLDPDQTANLLGLPDVMPMTSLARDEQRDPQATFLGQPLAKGQYEANILLTQPGTIVPNVRDPDVIGSATRTDSVFRAAGVYASPSRLAMFGETHFDLQYDDFKTHERVVTTLGRFSFLPQLVFSSSLLPVVVGDQDAPEGDFLPGMMIPENVRSEGNLEVIIPHYTGGKLERLITPARFRLQAQEGCMPLNIVTQATAQSPPAVAFFCGTKFIQVPLVY